MDLLIDLIGSLLVLHDEGLHVLLLALLVLRMHYYLVLLLPIHHLLLVWILLILPIEILVLLGVGSDIALAHPELGGLLVHVHGLAVLVVLRVHPRHPKLPAHVAPVHMVLLVGLAFGRYHSAWVLLALDAVALAELAGGDALLVVAGALLRVLVLGAGVHIVIPGGRRPINSIS